MRNFFLGILTVVILALVGGGAYYYGRQTNTSSPSSPKETTTGTTPTPTGQSVGNDQDEHGCRPSAGYSWCEVKQKCLRSFEEACPTVNDNDLISQALYQKNKWAEGSVTVTVATNDGQYASGTVTAQGGGGYFYAAKVNNQWEIVADGNGVILCSALTKYPNYPKTLISECYNEATGKTVKR